MQSKQNNLCNAAVPEAIRRLPRYEEVCCQTWWWLKSQTGFRPAAVGVVLHNNARLQDCAVGVNKLAVCGCSSAHLPACQLPDGWQHHQVEGHDAAHRVAGEAEHQQGAPACSRQLLMGGQHGCGALLLVDQ